MRIFPNTTVDYEFQQLGSLGHSGSLNDRQFSFLRTSGYRGALADMLAQYLNFSPLNLFTSSEPGVWLDPSDLSTLFQDDAGTTPVTAAGQSVGMVRDKSGRGNHATQSIFASRPIYGVEPSTGRRNLLTYSEDLTNAVWSKTSGGTGVSAIVTANTVSAPDGITTADTVVFNKGAGTTTADISTVSQAVSTTVQTAHSVWIRADAPVTLVFRNPRNNGTYLQLNVTTEWQRVSVTDATAPVSASNFEIGLRGGTGVVVPDTATVYIWGAQLEIGSTASPYQRVVSQYDVSDPVGFPSYPCHYLAFDGVDDFLVTPTITPDTDKVQVFAGVRKLSNAATGVPFELGNASNGGFALFAPFGAANNYTFRSRGTVAADAEAVGYTPPITNIVTGLGDILGDRSTIRVNGAQVAQTTTDQGTGNYLAYPHYIGRRGGTSFPFNGRLYGLITRFGPNLTADQISQIERWMAQRTGVVL